MPKKKAKKELDKALLCRIEEEMAEPHIAKSAREPEVGQDAPQDGPQDAPQDGPTHGAEATDTPQREVAPSLPAATAKGGRH